MELAFYQGPIDLTHTCVRAHRHIHTQISGGEEQLESISSARVREDAAVWGG